MSTDNMDCPKCGANNDSDAEKCIQCGLVFCKYRIQNDNRQAQIENEELYIRAKNDIDNKDYHKAQEHIRELLASKPENEDAVVQLNAEIERQMIAAKDERSKIEKLKSKAKAENNRKRLEEKARRRQARQDEKKLLVPWFIRQDLPPVETPFISRVFFVFASLSLISGLFLCYLTWPEKPPRNYEWKAVAYSMPITWIWIGFIEAVVFWALGQGMMYLKGIYENTTKTLE